MKILTENIENLTFDDIVAHCEEQIPEGDQIDYKREFPRNDLAKSIAALANTRGGLIIIGVEEDESSGLPISWEGLPTNAQLVERAYQIRSNVEPFPNCTARLTNAENGKVFLLIRVFEGDKPPYRRTNDPNIWLRNGNVSSHIELASAEAVELMYNKQIKAEGAREINTEFSQLIYDSLLTKSEKERRGLLAEDDRRAAEGSPRQIYREELGSQATMCFAEIQPYYPQKKLTDYDTLLEMNTWAGTSFFYTDHFHSRRESISGGLCSLHWGHTDGQLDFGLVLSNGFISSASDVLIVREHHREIHIAKILKSLLSVLGFARMYYEKTGYLGVLSGKLSVHNVKNSQVYLVNQDRFYTDVKDSTLAHYSWDLELDTNILFDDELLKQFLKDKIREINWSFGYPNPQDQAVENLLRSNMVFDLP